MGNIISEDISIGLVCEVSHISDKSITDIVGIALDMITRGENALWIGLIANPATARIIAKAKDIAKPVNERESVPPTAVQKVLPDISARSSLNTRAGRGRISSISTAIAAIYHMSINTPTVISGENRTIMLLSLALFILLIVNGVFGHLAAYGSRVEACHSG